MKSFINPFSYKCLLGPQAKNNQIINNLASWTVGKKHHFTNIGLFDQNDLDYLRSWAPSNFHYLSEENVFFLKTNGFKVSKTKLNSCCIDLENLAYVGRKYHGIRGAINKCSKHNFTIQDNFNKIEDIKIMIDEWSNVLAQKYWQDHSGKNLFFYKNDFHKDCNNIFVYDQEKLVAFASLSPGEYGSYIIGKALCNQYPGLSEYTDDLAYKKALTNRTKTINLGQSKGNLATYKDKWPNTYDIIHFDGSINEQAKI